MDATISAEPFRTEVAYRSTGSGGVAACGFLLRGEGDAQPCRNRVADHYEAVYVLRGSGRLTDWRGRAHTLVPGSVVQIAPGARHTLVRDNDEQWAQCFVHVDAGFAEHLGRIGGIDLSRPLLRPGLHAGLVRHFERILETLRHGPDDAQPLALLAAHELLLDMHRLDRQNDTSDRDRLAVDRACLALCDDLTRYRSIDAVAGSVRMTGQRLRQAFADRTGLTPGDYRVRRRIDLARELIVERRLTDLQVAEATGYERPSGFQRQFRHVVGQTPDAFRVNA